MNLGVATKTLQTGMGEPVGKASGRTLNRISTHAPDTCWSSLSLTPPYP